MPLWMGCQAPCKPSAMVRITNPNIMILKFSRGQSSRSGQAFVRGTDSCEPLDSDAACRPDDAACASSDQVASEEREWNLYCRLVARSYGGSGEFARSLPCNLSDWNYTQKRFRRLRKLAKLAVQVYNEEASSEPA